MPFHRTTQLVFPAFGRSLPVDSGVLTSIICPRIRNQAYMHPGLLVKNTNKDEEKPGVQAFGNQAAVRKNIHFFGGAILSVKMPVFGKNAIANT
jgi:hypothetical protein